VLLLSLLLAAALPSPQVWFVRDRALHVVSVDKHVDHVVESRARYCRSASARTDGSLPPGAYLRPGRDFPRRRSPGREGELPPRIRRGPARSFSGDPTLAPA
jgi:hypothetical protein